MKLKPIQELIWNKFKVQFLLSLPQKLYNNAVQSECNAN